MRPKEFNRNSVLEKCIVLFWQEGYNGTGVQRIVDKTMVNRYSLYDEFGNKEGILLASLELFIERHIPWELLSDSGSMEDVLFEFYASFFRPSITNKHPIGCYITTMAMELRETDVMQFFFNSFLDTLSNKFALLLQTKSSIQENEALSVAKKLTMFYCTSMGMYVIFSQKETEKYIEDNIKLIIKCLSR